MKKIKAVIFDMDGTIMNTLEDLKDSTNYVLSSHGYENKTLDQIREYVGNGIRKLIARAVPEGTDEATIDICFKEMKEYYAEHSLIKTAPYEGIKKTIIKLKEAGIKIAIVTNKVQPTAEFITAKFFGDDVELVVGDNGDKKLKPEADGILYALKILGCTKEEAIYIGDSEVDVATAQNAGIDFIGVLWGFRSKKILETNGATVFAENCFELEKKLIK